MILSTIITTKMMMMSGNKIGFVCPECQASIRLKKPPVVSQQVTCGHCHAKLEVTQVNPVELWPVNEEELFYSDAPRRQSGGKRPVRRHRSYDEWD